MLLWLQQKSTENMGEGDPEQYKASRFNCPGWFDFLNRTTVSKCRSWGKGFASGENAHILHLNAWVQYLPRAL